MAGIWIAVAVRNIYKPMPKRASRPTATAPVPYSLPSWRAIAAPEELAAAEALAVEEPELAAVPVAEEEAELEEPDEPEELPVDA